MNEMKVSDREMSKNEKTKQGCTMCTVLFLLFVLSVFHRPSPSRSFIDEPPFSDEKQDMFSQLLLNRRRRVSHWSTIFGSRVGHVITNACVTSFVTIRVNAIQCCTGRASLA